MNIKNTNKDDQTIRGVTFKSGVSTYVSDEELAQKVLAIPGYVIARKRGKNNAKNKA